MSEPRATKPRYRMRNGVWEEIPAPDADVPPPAPVAAADAAPAVAKPVPWRGRQRVPDPRTAYLHARCTPAEHARVAAAAAQAGLTPGAYVRATVLGAAGPRTVRRPSADHAALARVLGLLGNYTGNLNQLARVANTTGELPTASELHQLAENVAELRQGVMHALGRELPHGD